MSDLIDREALLRQIDIDSEGEPGYYGDTWKFIDTIKRMPSALGANLAEVGTDLISRAKAIEALSTITLYKGSIPYNTAVMRIEQLPSAQLDTYWKEQCQSYEQTINKLIESLSTQPEIIQCKDCKHWVPGYITDNDDFIPPKCGEWRQMVGHSSDDYCSLAERREVTT